MEREARKTIEKKLGLILLNELKKENIKAAENVTKHIKDAVKTITRKFAKEIKAAQRPSKTPPIAIIANPVTLDEMNKSLGALVSKVKTKAKSASNGGAKKSAVKKASEKPEVKKPAKKRAASEKPKAQKKAIKKPVGKIKSETTDSKRNL